MAARRVRAERNPALSTKPHRPGGLRSAYVSQPVDACQVGSPVARAHPLEVIRAPRRDAPARRTVRCDGFCAAAIRTPDQTRRTEGHRTSQTVGIPQTLSRHPRGAASACWSLAAISAKRSPPVSVAAYRFALRAWQGHGLAEPGLPLAPERGWEPHSGTQAVRRGPRSGWQ